MYQIRVKRQSEDGSTTINIGGTWYCSELPLIVDKLPEGVAEHSGVEISVLDSTPVKAKKQK